MGIQLSVRGNPMVGLYARAAEEFAVVGVKDESILEAIRDELDVDVVATTVAGSELVGAMLAANSNGILVCKHVTSRELEIMRKVADVYVVDTDMTCLGNVICVNDRGAIIHPEADMEIERAVEKRLDVEVARGTVGGIKTVGMAAAVTNRGGLLHPNANDWEVRKVEKILKIETEKGTVNFGQDMVGAGVIANSRGYIVGDDTTGFELGVLEQALGFVEW